MKLTLMVGATLFLASTLTGCVVVPAEPVVYAPPPPAVVVRPAYRPHHYHHYHHPHRPYWRRYWR